MKASRKCSICHNDSDITLLYKQEFLIPEDYKGLPEVYSIVECNGCGFVYADMAASQAVYENYYERNSKYESLNSSSSTGGINKRDIARFENAFKEFKTFINANNQILDVGCANGGLLYVLKSHGFNNIVGLEMSERCVANVGNLRIDCSKGGCFSVPDDFKCRFDMIILSHVLEHIYDLETAMYNICGMLNDDGMIYIDVPDASRYYDYYIKPFYYFDLEHINHFTIQTLTNLGRKFGLKVISSHEKDIEVNPKFSYPTVSALFKKGTGATDTMTMERGSNESIKKYIAKSHDNDVCEKLNELKISQEEIIVWGVGAYTLSIFRKGLSECNIVAVVDSNTKKQGMLIGGLRVEDPSVIGNYKATILILSALYQEEIAKQIVDMKTLNTIKSIY